MKLVKVSLDKKMIVVSLLLLLLAGDLLAEEQCHMDSQGFSCQDKMPNVEQLIKAYQRGTSNYKLKDLANTPLELTSFVEDSSKTTKSIQISDSRLFSIQDGFFSKLAGGANLVKELTLSHVILTNSQKFGQKHLQGLEKSLKMIRIVNGPTVEPDAFDKLTELEVIHIDGNEISELSNSITSLLQATNIRQISLKNTKIAAFPDWQAVVQLMVRSTIFDGVDMENSPLACDDRVKPIVRLTEEINLATVINMIRPKVKNFICASPEKLKGRDLTELRLKDIDNALLEPMIKLDTIEKTENVQEPEKDALRMGSIKWWHILLIVLLLLLVLIILVGICVRQCKQKQQGGGYSAPSNQERV